MHDAIMVGIGTALNDDPQLNSTCTDICYAGYLSKANVLPRLARHVPASGSTNRYHLPRPVVLDSNLRLPVHCKLLNNFRDGRGRRPWVVGIKPSNSDLSSWQARRFALEGAGARVIEAEGQDGAAFASVQTFFH